MGFGEFFRDLCGDLGICGFVSVFSTIRLGIWRSVFFPTIYLGICFFRALFGDLFFFADLFGDLWISGFVFRDLFGDLWVSWLRDFLEICGFELAICLGIWGFVSRFVWRFGVFRDLFVDSVFPRFVWGFGDLLIFLFAVCLGSFSFFFIRDLFGDLGIFFCEICLGT